MAVKVRHTLKQRWEKKASQVTEKEAQQHKQ